MIALDAAAPRAIDHRVARRDEQIAGRDDVGASEEHDDVAVGVGGRLMQELDGFVVEEDLLVGAVKNVSVGHAPNGAGACCPVGALIRASTRSWRDDARRGRRQAEVARRVPAEPPADLRDRLVAAGVIGVHVLLMRMRIGLSVTCRIAASTSSLVPRAPVSTSSTPSSPICTVMFPPAPTSM